MLSYFASLFSYGLHLSEQLSKGTGHIKSSGEVNAELLGKLESVRLAAQQAGKRLVDIDEAAFAIVAWLDETLASHYEWWGSVTPLQVSLFHIHNAGNEFFAHLEKLTAEQDEVREVYYVALCLGFKGLYYYEQGDTGRLAALKDMHSRQLPLAPAILGELVQSKITPQPYGVPDPKGPRIPGRWPERLARAGLVVAAVIVIGILGYYYWTMRPELAPPEQAAAPTVSAVTQIVAGQGCRDIEVSQDSMGALSVGGHAPHLEAKQQITEAIRRLPGGASVNISLVILPNPFCEVVAIATPLRRHNLSQDLGFTVKLRGGKDHLFEGDPIIIDAKMPAEPACLYVDYFSADGSSVVHVYRSGGKSAPCASARQQILIGEPHEGRTPWAVSPPFGQEMVLAVASRKPLFDANRDEIESPAEYLKALSAALQRHGESTLADFSLLTTAPAK